MKLNFEQLKAFADDNRELKFRQMYEQAAPKRLRLRRWMRSWRRSGDRS